MLQIWILLGSQFSSYPLQGHADVGIEHIQDMYHAYKVVMPGATAHWLAYGVCLGELEPGDPSCYHIFGLFEISQPGKADMISHTCETSPSQVLLEKFHDSHYCAQLLIGGRVVPLARIEGFGGIGNNPLNHSLNQLLLPHSTLSHFGWCTLPSCMQISQHSLID